MPVYAGIFFLNNLKLPVILKNLLKWRKKKPICTIKFLLTIYCYCRDHTLILQWFFIGYWILKRGWISIPALFLFLAL